MVATGLGEGATVRGRDKRSATERLDNGQAEPFGDRWDHHEVGSTVERVEGRVIDRLGPDDPFAEPWVGSDAVGDLVLATTRAVFAHEHVVVGHLFSALPMAGIDIRVVTDEMLATLAAAVRASGAVIEVNERWRTPGIDHIKRLCSLGVELVPSSDAHSADTVATWDYVAEASLVIAP